MSNRLNTLTSLCALALTTGGLTACGTVDTSSVHPTTPTTTSTAQATRSVNTSSMSTDQTVRSVLVAKYPALGNPVAGDGVGVVQRAQSACVILNQGYDGEQAVHFVASQYPYIETSEAAYIAGVGVGAYCPQYNSLIGN